MILEDALAVIAAARASASHGHERGTGGVSARAYLRVVDTLCEFTGALRGVAAMATADVAGNARKLTAHLAPGYAMVWELCVRELDAPGAERLRAPNCTDGIACTSVLWLQRALRFVVQGIRGVVNGDPSLSAVIASAYNATLGRHHGLLTRSAFHLATLATPSRDKFLRCMVIAPGVVVGEMQLTRELARVAKEAGALLGAVDKFLIREGVEEPWVA